MLSYFRAFSQSSFGKYLVVGIMALGLISFSFSGRFHTITSDAVIQAGSHEVSPAIFKRVFDNSLADLEKQAGQQTTPQDAVATASTGRSSKGWPRTNPRSSWPAAWACAPRPT